MKKTVWLVLGAVAAFAFLAVAGVLWILSMQQPAVVVNKYNITITSSNTEYGSIDVSSIEDVEENTQIVVSGNTVTVNGTTITATPEVQTAEYNYVFSGWTCPQTVTKDTNIVANFSRDVRTYTVAFETNSVDSAYGADGTFDALSVVVPYGTTVATEGNRINFTYGGQVLESVTATGNESCFKVRDFTLGATTITGTATMTANFVVKSDSDYDYLSFTTDATNVSVKLKYGQTVTVVDVPRLVKIDNIVYTSKSIKENGFKDLTTVTKLVLPSSVDTIGENAFSGCTGLTTFDFVSGITTVGAYAFKDTRISSITIPNTITSLGSNCFENCLYLRDVTFESGCQLTQISDNLFKGCTSLWSMDLPTGITSIGEYAFAGAGSNVNFETVIIPEGVITIGHGAFSKVGIKHPYIQTITIPKSVTTIEDFCFYGCDRLTTVTFADNSELQVIDGYAFDGCSSLSSINIPNTITTFYAGTFEGCSSLQSFTFVNGVTTIPVYFFKGCTSLTEVIMPTTLSTISYGAFRGCTGLTSFDIPASITTLGDSDSLKDSPFYGCSNLETVTFKQSSALTRLYGSVFKGLTGIHNIIFESGSQLATIDQYAFAGCTGLEVLDLRNTFVTEIPTRMCTSYDNSKNCPNLTTIYFPSGLQTIGGYAFLSTSLSSITFPQTLTSIGSYAFWGSAITSINFAAGGQLETLNEGCFAGTQIESIEIPSSVKYMYGCFYQCLKLQNVTYEAGSQLLSIGDQSARGALFRDCVKLTSIAFPQASCTIIPDEACDGCYNLREVIIPEGYQIISSRAFANCRSLTQIILPSTISSIYSNDSVSSAFAFCYRLVEVVNKSSLAITAGATANGYVAYWAKQVISDEANTKLSTIDDFIYYSDLKYILIDYIGISKTPTIMANCGEINQYAFYGRGVERIVIPDLVTKIGYGAFTNCFSLESITIGSGVTQILSSTVEMQETFYGCWYLTTVIINSQTIYSGATNTSAYGLLLDRATTIMVLSTLTDGNSYLDNTSIFTMEIVGDYKVYTKI